MTNMQQILKMFHTLGYMSFIVTRNCLQFGKTACKKKKKIRIIPLEELVISAHIHNNKCNGYIYFKLYLLNLILKDVLMKHISL